MPQETSPFITAATFATERDVDPGPRFERLAVASPIVRLKTVASPCDAAEEIDGERMFDERHRASACGIGDEALERGSLETPCSARSSSYARRRNDFPSGTFSNSSLILLQSREGSSRLAFRISGLHADTNRLGVC